MSTPIYLDCDTGIDDALALAYLLRAGANIVGIGTVSGNVSSSVAARNTLHLLELAGRDDIPVAIGASHPLGGDFAGGAPDVHGVEGLGKLTIPEPAQRPDARHATALLNTLTRQAEGQLHILAIGPLTNIALALQEDPTIADRIAHVYIMGGAVNVAGNVTSAAEANIFNDPEAADIVLSANWNVTLVPLDVTMRHVITEADVRLLSDQDDDLLAAVAEAFDAYLTFYENVYGERVAALHDPLAAAIAVDALPIANVISAAISVDTSRGPTRGRTCADHTELGRPAVTVVLETEDASTHILDILGVRRG